MTKIDLIYDYFVVDASLKYKLMIIIIIVTMTKKIH